jgi:outer membrane protein OmpA-like peptidoglycan-associated protein
MRGLLLAVWSVWATTACGPATGDGGGAAEPTGAAPAGEAAGEAAGASRAPARPGGSPGEPGGAAYGPDLDADGVVDADDACPGDPEDRDGFQDVDGCPEPDNDLDRVPDVQDQCPNQPETPDGVADEDGCPEQGGANVGSAYRFVEPIEFDGGSDDLTPDGEAALRRTAERLAAHPEWLAVALASHSDSRGSSTRNLDLTRHRAGLLRERLIALGIADDRLIAVGFGELCPWDPRAGADGNRRVELVVLETTDGCTGESIGCASAVEQLTLSSRLREYLPGSERCGGAAPAP